MKARTVFDAIGVIAASAVVAEQAIELLAPCLKRVEINPTAYLPAIVRDIPARTANAFAAFTTAPGAYAKARHIEATAPAPNAADLMPSGLRAPGTRRPNGGPRMAARDRLTHQPA